MFLISAVAYLDRVNISIAGTAIANEFHLDNVHLGWVFSAFVLGYALFQTPGGALADRIGPRLIILIGVIWWAIFSMLITLFSPATAGLLGLLIVVRFSLGVGEAVVYPASNCLVASWIPNAERGIANGIIFAGVGFGAGVTPPLINHLISHYGWRSSFWASAALGLVVGIVWYVIARNTPREHPRVSPAELEFIEQGLPSSGESKGKSSRLSWGAILRNGNIWAVTFAYFAFGYAAYIFFTWFYIYLSTVRHLNIKQSTFYTMLPFIAMTVGSPLGGWISDRLTKRAGPRVGRVYVAVAGIGCCALLIAVSTQVTSAQLASLVLACGAGSLYISQSSFWSVSADIGRKSAGSVSALMNMGGQLGGAVTASLTPAIAKNFGWTASFLTAAALVLAGALAWLLVKVEHVEHETATAH
jgi:ACS family glucarate transporter-like MFS transporter